jgi:integrase
MLKLIKRNDSPHWQIRGTLRGVRVRESTCTDSRPHAEAILAKRQQEILDRSTYGEQHTATWAEAVNLYLDLGGDARYLAPLVLRWGTWRLAAITPLEIARAGREIYPNCKPATIDRQLYTPVISVMRCAAQANLCPMPAIKRPTVKRAKVSPSDDASIDTLMAAKGKIEFKAGSRGEARQKAARTRLRALVLIMSLTGCRVSEAVRVERRDVRLDVATPDVLFRDTKNGDPRRAILPAELVEALRALPDGQPESRLLGYSSRYTAAQALERACAASGVAHVSPHQVGRHTFAARLLDAGHTLKTVQEAGGWKDIGIVARTYGHLERSRVEAAVRDAAGTRLTRQADGQPTKVLPFKAKN